MTSYTSTPYADTFALAKALAQAPLDTPVTLTIQTDVLPEDGERVTYMCAVADIEIKLSGIPPDHNPPDPVPEPTIVMFAKTDGANIRYEPTTASGSAAQLRAGTPVTVVKDRIFDGTGGNTLKWYKVTEPTPGFMATITLTDSAPPIRTEQLWAIDDVNIRSEPSTKGGNRTVIGVMAKAQMFEFRQGERTAADGYNFAAKADGIGFVADKWLTNAAPIPPPAPQPPPPTRRHPTSVIGLHISPNIDGGPSVAIDHLSRRARAGRPAAGVLLCDPGYGVQVEVQDIRQVSPETEIGVRRTAGDYEHPTAWVGATAAQGRQFVNDFFAQWLASKPSVLDADFQQLFNEPKPIPTFEGLNGFNLWLNGVLDRAAELNFKIFVPVFSTGFGRLREFNDVEPFYWELPSTIELIDRVIREKQRLAIHAYRSKAKLDNRWDDPWELFRHEAIYRVLPANRRPELAILEYGDERVKHKGIDTFESNINYTVQRMQQSPLVKWVGLWGVGETSDMWREDRIEVFVPNLTEVLLR